MNLAVSNIAWTPEEDAAAYELLKEYGVRTLEVAPGRLWPKPADAGLEEVSKALEPIRAAGLSVVAFQAILYGKPELTMFESSDIRVALIDYLSALARTAAACGARPLVFGAPKNRQVPSGMTASEANEIATDFFKTLGVRAAAVGVYFCLEANPTAYGCNFATHMADAAALVRRVDSPGLRLQLDSGECAMNEEVLQTAVVENLDIIGHVHISEPMLNDFSQPWKGHSELGRILTEHTYSGIISIEMKRPSTGLAGVAKALTFVRDSYGLC